MSEEQPEDFNTIFDQLAGTASMSPLDQQSHELHEMFLSLTRVGFSEKQALFIVSMALISLDFDGEPEEQEFIISIPEDAHPSNNEVDLHPSDEDFSEFDEEEDSPE